MAGGEPLPPRKRPAPGARGAADHDEPPPLDERRTKREKTEAPPAADAAAGALGDGSLEAVAQEVGEDVAPVGRPPPVKEDGGDAGVDGDEAVDGVGLRIGTKEGPTEDGREARRKEVSGRDDAAEEVDVAEGSSAAVPQKDEKVGGSVDDADAPVSQASGMLVREFVELIGQMRGALRELVPRAPPLVAPPEPAMAGSGGGGGASPQHWANLLSQHYLVPHVQLDRPVVVVGRAPKSSVQLPDPELSPYVARFMWAGNKALVEPLGATAMQLNNRALGKGVRAIMRSGDEIEFHGGSTRYSFVFQMLGRAQAKACKDGIAAAVKALIGEAGEKRARSKAASVAVAAPSSTAAVSARAADTALAGLGVSTETVAHAAESAEGSADAVPEVAVEVEKDVDAAEAAPADSLDGFATPPRAPKIDDASLVGSKKKGEGKVVTFGDVTVVSMDDAKTPNDDPVLLNKATSVSIAAEKTASDQLKARVAALGRTADSQLPASKTSPTASAAGGESPEILRLRYEARTKAVHQAAAEFYERHLVRADDIDVSFEKFPYSYLSDDLRNHLVAWAYGHLLHPDVIERLSSLPSISSPRVLLSGANGTEVYLERIVYALAKNFGADLLAIDMKELAEMTWDLREPADGDGKDHAKLNAALDEKLGISKLTVKKDASAASEPSASKERDGDSLADVAAETVAIETGAQAMALDDDPEGDPRADAADGSGEDGPSVTTPAASSPMNGAEGDGMAADTENDDAIPAAKEDGVKSQGEAPSNGGSNGEGAGAARKCGEDGAKALETGDGTGVAMEEEAEEEIASETLQDIAVEADVVAMDRAQPQSLAGQKTSTVTGAKVFKFGDRVVFLGRHVPLTPLLRASPNLRFEEAVKAGLLGKRRSSSPSSRASGRGMRGSRLVGASVARGPSYRGGDHGPSLYGQMTPAQMSQLLGGQGSAKSQTPSSASRDIHASLRAALRGPSLFETGKPLPGGGGSSSDPRRRVASGHSSVFGPPPLTRDPRDKSFCFGPRDKISKPRARRTNQQLLFGGDALELGPKPGAVGHVVLTFEDDAKRVGVRFDEEFSGGSDLGNLCEHTHGFFCRTDELELHWESNGEVSSYKPVPVFVETLFAHMAKVRKERSLATPLVLYIRDAQRVLSNLDDQGDPNTLIELETALKTLGSRTILLGTSVPNDIRSYVSRRGRSALSASGDAADRSGDSVVDPFSLGARDADKSHGSMPAIQHFLVRQSPPDLDGDARDPYGILRPSSSGKSASPMGIDSNFIDHLVRMEDRGDRIGDGGSKGNVTTASLFPKSFLVELPPLESLLHVHLKKELEADAKRLKLEMNVKSFEELSKCFRLRCDKLSSVKALSDRLFCDKEICNILGLAVSAQLMDDDRKNKKQVMPTSPPPESAEASGSTSSASAGSAAKSASAQQEDGAGGVAADAEGTYGTYSMPLVVPLDDSVDLGQFFSQAIAKVLRDGQASGAFRDGTERALDRAKAKGNLQREKGAILELTPAAILKGIAMSKSHAKAETGSGPKEWTSKALKNVTPDNEFERKLLSEGVVVPAEEVGVKFDDIGALDSVKEVLQEVVMLPLRRPGLFRKGNLAVPTKGVLLFGLPGTGKTLSAKAVATEAGANFINITMSSITSKWFGEGEKYVRAVFTLARKLSPAVIYVDEVDSMLGRRERPGEHEAMRKIKNEFMLQWDGLRSTDADRVLVLGSTNRPFDLDDAVLRRFPRRLMVDLPDSGSRARILKKITEKEELAADVDLEALAETLDGYSGSDLRNLCVSAAMEPVREILAAERAANGGEIGGAGGLKKSGCGGDGNGDSLEVEEAEEEEVRALEMRDFQKAATSMSASVSEDAPSVAELRKWNATYGENGSRRKEPLAYFM